MSIRRVRNLGVLVMTVIALGAIAAWSLDTQSGDWTMRKSDVQGKVHLSLIRDSSEGGHSQSSSDCLSTSSRAWTPRPAPGTT